MFTYTPIQMLLRLINIDNTVHISEENLRFEAPVVIENPTPEEITVNGAQVTITRNTAIDVTCINLGLVPSVITFKYERVSLNKLFSEVSPTIKTFDVIVDDAVDIDALYTEILRKFGIQLTVDSFDFVLVDKTVTISAKVDNVAYTGQFDVVLSLTLADRIRTLILDGFTHVSYPKVTNGTFSLGDDGLDYWAFDNADGKGNFTVVDGTLVAAGTYAGWTPIYCKSAEQKKPFPSFLTGQTISFDILVEYSTVQLYAEGSMVRTMAVTEDYVTIAYTLKNDCNMFAFGNWDGYSRYKIRNVKISNP